LAAKETHDACEPPELWINRWNGDRRPKRERVNEIRRVSVAPPRRALKSPDRSGGRGIARGRNQQRPAPAAGAPRRRNKRVDNDRLIVAEPHCSHATRRQHGCGELKNERFANRPITASLAAGSCRSYRPCLHGSWSFCRQASSSLSCSSFSSHRHSPRGPSGRVRTPPHTQMDVSFLFVPQQKVVKRPSDNFETGRRRELFRRLRKFHAAIAKFMPSSCRREKNLFEQPHFLRIVRPG
jgi:hypothetical protein